MMGLQLKTKQKVRQAVVKFKGGGLPSPLPRTKYVSRNGLTIGRLTKKTTEETKARQTIKYEKV